MSFVPDWTDWLNWKLSYSLSQSRTDPDQNPPTAPPLDGFITCKWSKKKKFNTQVVSMETVKVSLS